MSDKLYTQLGRDALIWGKIDKLERVLCRAKKHCTIIAFGVSLYGDDFFDMVEVRFFNVQADARRCNCNIQRK